MVILKAVLLLLAGFVFLSKGADFFVEGASSVAKMLKVPSLIIGMTIVAMGTSLPELSVSVTASMNGSNALAISNVIGSNIFNLMVVLGFSAVITPLLVGKDVLKKDYPFSLFCAILLLVLGFIQMELGHIDGIIFLVIFAAFLISQIISAQKARAASLENEQADEEDSGQLSFIFSVIYIIGGACAVKFGGDWVVSGAVSLATVYGLSENLIGLTIVALGTSLPELVTSIAAARRNELDMAIGNVVGSNIFNILMILGVAAAISPITFVMENVMDIGILLVFSAIVWVFCFTKGRINRREGIIMLLLYAVYLVYICNR